MKVTKLTFSADQRFVVRDAAPALVTRKMGATVREQIAQLARDVPDDVRIIIDLTGIDVLTPSFADECLGRLVSELGLRDFQHRFRVETDREEWKSLVNSVVRNRLRLDKAAG